MITFYLISAVSVFWLVFYILHDLFQLNSMVIVPLAIAYLVMVVILYSFIHVITYIPANLAGAFDPVKNKIATGGIRTGRELTASLSEFMTTFFDFAFFDVECTVVRIGSDLSTFPQDLVVPEADLDLEMLEIRSREAEDTLYMGKIITDGRKMYLYVIPLVFGEMWLGYMAVMTRQRLWGMFRRLLSEFENDFVDDQVVHVVGMEPELSEGINREGD